LLNDSAPEGVKFRVVPILDEKRLVPFGPTVEIVMDITTATTHGGLTYTNTYTRNAADLISRAPVTRNG